MSEVNPEAGGTPPEPAPTITPPEPAALTDEQVNAYLVEKGYTAYPANDPRWEKFNAQDQVLAPAAMPKADDFDPFDQNHIARVVQEQTKDLDAKLSEAVAGKVMAQLTPILSQFAQTQVLSGARPEAKPFVEQVMKEFNVTPFQLAQDPKTAQLVNDAAELRALKAGKIAPGILFPSDPPGGTGTGGPTIGDDAQQMLRMSESFLGRALTEDEKKVRIDEFELAKKREGLGV